jgi:tetratricopeptide (TPR) repeat protein
MFPPAQTALANAASATPIQPTAQAERVQEAILPDSQGPQILATSPLTAGDIGPVVAPPAVAALPVPPATPTPFPIPANAVPAVNQAGLANTPASDNAEPPVAAAPPSPGDSVQRSCRKAIDDRQNKTILSTCAEAFTANPSAADIAVLLAKIEFDRGRVAQAFEWSKKAIAVNPNLADAYVFIGEAEQNAGHSKAAKDAYLRYLRLAPGGRYASDLRAVIHSL